MILHCTYVISIHCYSCNCMTILYISVVHACICTCKPIADDLFSVSDTWPDEGNSNENNHKSKEQCYYHKLSWISLHIAGCSIYSHPDHHCSCLVIKLHPTAEWLYTTIESLVKLDQCKDIERAPDQCASKRRKDIDKGIKVDIKTAPL